MLTLKTLEEYGADVADGMNRCLNNEAFYLKLVQNAAETTDLASLKDALDQKDLAKAFELSHAMKGVFRNLSLTPLAEPVSEMNEMLRGMEERDYSELFSVIDERMQKLRELCA